MKSQSIFDEINNPQSQWLSQSFDNTPSYSRTDSYSYSYNDGKPTPEPTKPQPTLEPKNDNKSKDNTYRCLCICDVSTNERHLKIQHLFINN